MFPIYKFELTIESTTERCFPLYKDDLAKDFERESGQQFFREKLTGKLTFEGPDYARIVAAAFDTQFLLSVFISYNGGSTWSQYWSGTFWKTDCDFDMDAETVIVTPTVVDNYNNILSGMDKEYNLIELAPEIVPIKYDKRPMVQVYVPGQTVIGCFLSGMWWETECEAISDTSQLENHFGFALNKKRRVASVSGTMSPQLPPAFVGAVPTTETDLWEVQNGEYKCRIEHYSTSGGTFVYWRILRASDDAILWWHGQSTHDPVPYTVTLQPYSGAGTTGNVELTIYDVPVYARYICDVLTVSGQNTSPIPSDDLVPDNRNYTRMIPYDFSDEIFFSQRFSATPTEWGLFQPGQYYQKPYVLGQEEFFPIARSAWGAFSIWFSFGPLSEIVEESGRAENVLRDTYPLASAISVLLAKIAPELTHAETAQYSQFLYGTNPITGISQRLLITPKSNVITAGYDQPAQKAMITFRAISDMLRDCFRCYWFIDSQKRLRIEHISYFMKGGSYSGTPTIGIDLTWQTVSRSGKPWAFARNQYQFDKPEMAARYQFSWMDDVTQLFEGFPIDIRSKYVNPDNIEDINVSKFTSDIDYILLNPGDISKDGFVLLAATLQSGEYKLPYANFIINDADHYLQNAYVAFIYLQGYYAYDMPAWLYSINGENKIALGVKKLKSQTIRFPMPNDPDLYKLIKTNLGNGQIRKMSLNLSSRSAQTTLEYDTE